MDHTGASHDDMLPRPESYCSTTTQSSMLELQVIMLQQIFARQWFDPLAAHDVWAVALSPIADLLLRRRLFVACCFAAWRAKRKPQSNLGGAAKASSN
jgi:hypothetical protein